MRISDWSSDVCSSDLDDLPAAGVDLELGHHLRQIMASSAPRSARLAFRGRLLVGRLARRPLRARRTTACRSDVGGVLGGNAGMEIGRASGRERGCKYV